jgi:hypothetical protein
MSNAAHLPGWQLGGGSGKLLVLFWGILRGGVVILRCVLDGLLLPAEFDPDPSQLVAYDGDEGFRLEAVEAVFYELVSASGDELVLLQRAGYRLLRIADDFRQIEGAA